MITVAGCPNPAEDLVLRNDTADVGDDQGAEGDDVVADPPPEQHAEDCGHQGEEESLIGGHGGVSGNRAG